MKKCILIGGGGHAKVVLDAIIAEGRLDPVGFVDPDKSSPLSQTVPHLGSDTELSKILSTGIKHAVISVGDLPSKNIREFLTKKLVEMGFEIESVIHPSAIVAKDVALAKGIQVLAGVIINPGSKVEEGVVINTGARIDHDCVLGAFSSIAPGAVVCGGVTIGRGAYIGAGAVVIQSVSIAAGVIVGAGAVVTKSISALGTYVGVPARVTK